MLSHPNDGPIRVSAKIYHQHKLVYETDFDGPMEIGRQRPGEPAPFNRLALAGGTRLIIAKIEETTVSRQHARLELRPDGRVRVTNCSGSGKVAVDSIGSLAAGNCFDVPLPVLLTVGDKAVRLEPTPAEDLRLESLAEPTLAPGQSSEHATRLAHLISRVQDTAGTQRLLRSLQTTMGVLQSAASSADFPHQAARAAAEIVGLDTAAVLLWDGDQWKIDAVQATTGDAADSSWTPSRTMLERVRTERRTFRHIPHALPSEPRSLADVDALVAAPILNSEGHVIGALYGDRRAGDRAGGQVEISELEAMLVELLAGAVAAGWARVERERAALAARIRFEQFFTPELARRLESEPDLLTGREADVTVLFCDIRGFSRVSERLGPARTVAWINDVLSVLSDCVIAHQGVLVDYIGDELMAMWGAPDERADHAELACGAALQMLQQLPALNERWQGIVGEPTGLGIGINTGPAQVGNTGSRRKFKYGPLGNTVNLASRVQGATKYVKSKLLITGATAARLDAAFATRRLCQVRVVNISEPVALYELAAEATADWRMLREQYEAALEAFDGRNFLVATRLLGNLLERHPTDGPTLALLARAVNALADAATFDPVWELGGK